MDKAEFDKFADEYASMLASSIKASGESPDFFSEYKIRDLAQYLARRGGKAAQLIDFGAGTGSSVPWLRKHLPNATFTCVDVSEKSLQLGRQRFPKEAHFVGFDGRILPFEHGSFDVAFSACVFHHIEHALHVPLLCELRRVLRPGGLLAIFEHNPFNLLTVHTVRTCQFDENAVLIRAAEMVHRVQKAGFIDIDRHYRIFFPGPLRGLRPLERWLRWCPLGAQYSVFARAP